MWGPLPPGAQSFFAPWPRFHSALDVCFIDVERKSTKKVVETRCQGMEEEKKKGSEEDEEKMIQSLREDDEDRRFNMLNSVSFCT